MDRATRSSAGWSLKLVLLLQYLGVSILPVLVTALLILILFFPRMSGNTQQNHLALSQAIAGQVSTHLNNAARDLQLLNSLLSQEAQPAYRQLLMDTFADNQKFYEAIYLTDKSGYVKEVGLPWNKRSQRNIFTGLDMSQKPFYKEALQGQAAVWSEIFLSAVGGRLSVAHAIPTQGGTLIGEIAVDGLPDIVADIRQQHQLTVMILDQSGQLIAHPDASLSQQQLNLTNIELVRRGLSGQTLSLPFSFAGENWFGSVIRMQDPAWLVIAAQPESAVFDKQRPLLTILLLSMAAGLIGASIVGFWAIRTMTQRFNSYASQAEALAKGIELDQEPLSSKIREFRQFGDDLKATGLAIHEREEELVSRENRFRALLDQSPLAIIEWDTEFRRRVINPAANRLLSIVEGQGETSSTVYEQVTGAVQEMLQSCRNGTRELVLDVPDRQPGSSRQMILMSHNTDIRDDQGQRIGYLSILQDVTEARRAEIAVRRLNTELEERVAARTQDLSQANNELQSALRNLTYAQSELVRNEKLAALGALVAGIAHELNTPIGNGLMAASSLKEEAAFVQSASVENRLTRSMFSEFLEHAISGVDIVQRNLNRASELISSFKQVAVDQSSAQRRQFDLRQHLNEVLLTLRPMLKKSPADVELDVPDGVNLDSYPGALAQTVTNLVQNAVHHGIEGRDSGTIKIVASVTENDEILLEVSDDGAGISREHLQDIFNPFFTTKLGRGGSGLGLNIVHNLVRNVLHGNIAVESEKDQGTRFVIRIPRVLNSSQKG